MTVCLSVPPFIRTEKLGAYWMDFYEISIYIYTYIYVITSRSIIIKLRNISQHFFRENQNINFRFITCFFKTFSFYEILYRQTGHR